MALAIAAIGFLMYCTNTETNPITGEKQYVSMTPQQEITLGLKAAPEMAAQMGGEVSSSDPRAQLVQKLGNYLIQNSVAKKGPWRFNFHLLADTKTVNAFALPGGQIFITLGLFNQLQTEAQLAGVLAHEMGHVIQRHSAEQLAKGQLGQILVTATAVGASGERSSGYEAAMLANVVNQMMQLRYSRGDELEADEWGLKIMEESGYNPKAMIEVMRILEKAAGKQHQPEMLLTHPYPESRIQKINAYLKEHPPSPNLKEGRSLKDLTSENSSFQNKTFR
jgi:predicted Zn-dependent protease